MSKYHIPFLIAAFSLCVGSIPAQASVLGDMIGIGAKLIKNASKKTNSVKDVNNFNHLIGQRFVEFSHVQMGFDEFDEKKRSPNGH